MFSLTLDVLKVSDLRIELGEFRRHLLQEIRVALTDQNVRGNIGDRILGARNDSRNNGDKERDKDGFEEVVCFHKGLVGMGGQDGQDYGVRHLFDRGVGVFIDRDFEIVLLVG